MTDPPSKADLESLARPSRARRLHFHEVSAETDNYDGLGADLKAARVRDGLDLSEISDKLRIRRAYLAAIEEGRFDDLPAPVYAVGFVRSYADLLGLDGESAVETFKRETSSLGDETKLVFPFSTPESRVPRGWLIALSLVLAGLIYAGWHYAEMNGRLATDRIPPVPEGLSALAPAPSGDRPAADAPAPADPVETEGIPVQAPAADTPASVDPVAAEAPSESSRADGADTGPPASGSPASGSPASADGSSAEPVDTAETPTPVWPVEAEEPPTSGAGSRPPTEASAVEPAAATAEPVAGTSDAPQPDHTEREPRAYGEDDGQVRIIVTATMVSWVQVTSADGELLLTRVLRPGDRYFVPDHEGLFLTTGNAGGLEIAVDGKVAPTLGQPGTVRRNVALAPGLLLAGTAVER